MFENFGRQFLLLSEIGVNVVRAFLESKYQPADFETFLENNEIKIFHLQNNYRSGCCTCVNFPRQQIIRKAQFDKLFVSNGQQCQALTQCCHCKVSARPNIQLVEMDLTLVSTLLHICFTLTPPQKDCVKHIRENRNEISHFAHNNDIIGMTFKTMWRTITNTTIHLAMCIGQSYCTEIQDRIRLLKERTFLPVEYTNSLLEIYQWKLKQDESTSKILQLLKTMQLEIVTRDERIDCMELRIIDAIRNQRSIESPNHTVDQSNNVSGLDVDDGKDCKLFREVQQLRQNGEQDRNDGMLYSLLVHIVLHGSSTKEVINLEFLLNIYANIYQRTIPSEIVSIETCLAALIPKYIDQVEEKFTPCSIKVAKAAIYSLRDDKCEFLVQNCSLDIFLDYVVPSGTNIEDFYIEIDACLLTSVLVQRIKSNADARSVGEYFYKLVMTHHNVETTNLLIDTLKESNAHFTPDHVIHLLDGLTKRGEKFSIFDKLEKLYNVFCRQVDEFGNIVSSFLSNPIF
ncbi:RPGRIP1L [Mytilus coruscus]|uniref:RPGRIP1L n=1 Tax=Mytilus coruscus TaxID=42192 RepID=A0A6J8CXC3_MYTCO|nr:RPGRIP1L [Mytilus coruscus]